MEALAFGEILWDVYGDKRTLGGAPLNVLGHIRRLGGAASIISSVGDDELGKLAREAIASLGIDSTYLHTSRYGTGRAVVELDNGIPSYHFDNPSAWDDISLSDEDYERLLSKRWSVFIYGTLSQRSETSRATLWRLLDTINADNFFFDVNFRQDFWDEKSVRKGLERATILKMNSDEKVQMASLLGYDEDELIPSLLADTPLEKIVVTYGANGSYCYTRGERFFTSAGEGKAIDTVGAGDSLSAAFIYFLSQGKGMNTSLINASLLADYVVQHRGAIPEYDDNIRRKLSI